MLSGKTIGEFITSLLEALRPQPPSLTVNGVEMVREANGSYKPIDPPAVPNELVHQLRSHRFYDTDSLAEYAKQKLDPTVAVIFFDVPEPDSCDPPAISLVSDERFGHNISLCALRWSKQFASIPGRYNHKQFVTLLQTLEPHIANAKELLMSLISLKYAKEIQFDADATDAHGYQFKLDMKTGKGLAHVPTEFTASIPVFQGSQPMNIKYRLEIITDRDSGPAFEVTEITRADDIEAAAKTELLQLRAALPGWNILLGKPQGKHK